MARVLVAALVAMIIAILARPALHRVPAPERVRTAHPRGGAAAPRGQAGHADDGRAADHRRRVDRLPRRSRDYTLPALTIFGTTLACGAIGFLDDFTKLRHRRSLGLAGRWKMLLLLAITVAVGFAAHHQQLSHSVFIPIVDTWIPLGPFWYVLLFLIIAGAVNGVNLTDGLDGLAAGTGIIALATFTAMAVTIFIRSADGAARAHREPPRRRASSARR